jgi:hypothetical protein
MRRIKRKKLVFWTSTIAVVALAAAAFAYWTANGTGSGNASVGTDAGVTITNVAFSGGPASDGTLYPGGTVDVAFDVNNSSSNTAVNVHKVVADDSVYTNGVEITGPPAAVTGCNPSWFTYSGATLAAAPGQHIAASGTYSAPAGSGTGNGGTLSMSDETSTNQDACKNAAITLHLKTDNSGI